jgi:tRNA (Thr-GGU) A37 N-methylase
MRSAKVGGVSSGKDANEAKTLDEALARRNGTLSVATFNSKVPQFATKVFPPLLNGGNIGVFATRSPHHPNPFGQSLVKILSVDAAKRRIVVSGLDMCDGSPILDIKPWNPADCPTCLYVSIH